MHNVLLPINSRMQCVIVCEREYLEFFFNLTKKFYFVAYLSWLLFPLLFFTFVLNRCFACYWNRFNKLGHLQIFTVAMILRRKMCVLQFENFEIL